MLRRTAPLVALLIALTACGGGDGNEADQKAPKPAKKPTASALPEQPAAASPSPTPVEKPPAPAPVLRAKQGRTTICIPKSGPSLLYQDFAATGPVRLTVARIAGPQVQLKHAWVAPRQPDGVGVTGIADWPLDNSGHPPSWAQRRPLDGLRVVEGHYILYTVVSGPAGGRMDRLEIDYRSAGKKAQVGFPTRVVIRQAC